MSNQPPKKETNLEASIVRLEAIVEQLESGDVDLEKSIDLYLEGKKLGATALSKLDALENRVRMVVSEDENGLVTEAQPEENRRTR